MEHRHVLVTPAFEPNPPGTDGTGLSAQHRAAPHVIDVNLAGLRGGRSWVPASRRSEVGVPWVKEIDLKDLESRKHLIYQARWKKPIVWLSELGMPGEVGSGKVSQPLLVCQVAVWHHLTVIATWDEWQSTWTTTTRLIPGGLGRIAPSCGALNFKVLPPFEASRPHKNLAEQRTRTLRRG